MFLHKYLVHGKVIKQPVVPGFSRVPPRPVMLIYLGISPKTHVGVPKLSGHKFGFPDLVVFMSWFCEAVFCSTFIEKSCSYHASQTQLFKIKPLIKEISGPHKHTQL